MRKQDLETDYSDQRLAFYAEDSNGVYTLIETGSYMSKNYLDDYRKKLRHFREKGIQQLRKKEISPVGFYIMLKEMAPADIASRIGVTRKKVLKHMKPEHFIKMRIETARKYAEVFGIHTSDLFCIPSYPESGDDSEVITEYTKRHCSNTEEGE